MLGAKRVGLWARTLDGAGGKRVQADRGARPGQAVFLVGDEIALTVRANRWTMRASSRRSRTRWSMRADIRRKKRRDQHDENVRRVGWRGMLSRRTREGTRKPKRHSGAAREFDRVVLQVSSLDAILPQLLRTSRPGSGPRHPVIVIPSSPVPRLRTELVPSPSALLAYGQGRRLLQTKLEQRFRWGSIVADLFCKQPPPFRVRRPRRRQSRLPCRRLRFRRLTLLTSP